MTPATGRRVAPLLALVIGLVLVLLAPAAGVVQAPRALAADTDLTLVTDANYDVRPDRRIVHVTVSITATYHKAETRTQKFYKEWATLAVLPGTTGFRVSGAPGAKVRVTTSASTHTTLRLDFGSWLYGGSSRTFKLEFDVKESSAASRQVRVGASLVSFPVWAFASTGAKGSTVSVTFPAGYAVSVEAGAFDRTEPTPDGGTRLATNALATPLTWFAYVVGEREATYVDSPLTVVAGGRSISLSMWAWNDDPAWAKRVGGLFSRALPALATDIGLPWPQAATTVVQESVSRTTGGYAGLYDPAASRIEVAYWADHLVVLHEAAHGWFNGGLVADRWEAEGFASLYAGRAAAALKETGASPELTDAVKAARIPLNDWAQQTGSQDRPVETYGYAASLELARLIAERAGDDALRQVWADASAHLGAYQPPAASGASGSAPSSAPETTSAVADWRVLLDLLEARTGKDFTDLWRAWVVTGDQAAALDARAAARTSYQQTLALADGWALPRAIRDGLRAWQFDAVGRLMADARTVLAQRTAVEDRAARDGLTVPDTMRRLFESGSLVDASAEAEAELNAMLTLEGALAARHDDPDILSRIGLLGADPEGDLAKAKAAFAASELDATLTAAHAALVAWDGSWQEGRRRALLAVAALASVLVVASAAAGAVRRARRSGTAPPGGTSGGTSGGSDRDPTDPRSA